MNKNRLSLHRQVALITGANSGIGAAIAREMARAGAVVVINYLENPEAAQSIADELSDSGPRAIAIRADVSNETEVDAMFALAIAELGTVDILVNNAGIQRDAPFVDMSLADWNEVISVNLTGQFLCARAAAREFLRRGIRPEISRAAGKIICISSTHEVIPWAGHVNYAASKAGLVQLMKSVAQELAPHRVRVNSIAPGAVKTPINQEVWTDLAAHEKLLSLIPYGRMAEPEEIAKVAVWLASDDADYITGTTIFADGGATLYPCFAACG